MRSSPDTDIDPEIHSNLVFREVWRIIDVTMTPNCWRNLELNHFLDKYS